jgi:hypothetical protein
MCLHVLYPKLLNEFRLSLVCGGQFNFGSDSGLQSSGLLIYKLLLWYYYVNLCAVVCLS